jgi:hypothetical protein
MTDIAAKLAAPFEDILKRYGVIYDDGEACWLWTRSTDRDGYGRLYWNGRQRAHRIAYELQYGINPRGFVIMHKCDTPRCINPRHLVMGTPKDNAHDRVTKGRTANRKGERHPLAQFTDAEIREIRTLAQSGLRNSDIATRYGTVRQNIQKIVDRISWGHVQ